VRSSLATDGGDLDDYDPRLRASLSAEAVRILRAFGFAGAHVVVIGGLVPSLLVPMPEPGLDHHVGTTDLDLCLSVALVAGDVGEYERLERSLRDAGFAMARDDAGSSISWRWVGGIGMPLTVEFFCAAADGRLPGRLFRPGGVVGGKLSALVLAAGGLIDRDARDLDVEVELPGGGGRTRQRLKVAGPASYLAAKADALQRREKNKDAYDIVWLVESWPGGQPAFAAELQRSVVFGELAPALSVLATEFATIDSAGAVKYGRFMARDTAGSDFHARRAIGAIRALLAALGPA
jgi:hypothetical protein